MLLMRDSNASCTSLSGFDDACDTMVITSLAGTCVPASRQAFASRVNGANSSGSERSASINAALNLMSIRRKACGSCQHISCVAVCLMDAWNQTLRFSCAALGCLCCSSPRSCRQNASYFSILQMRQRRDDEDIDGEFWDESAVRANAGDVGRRDVGSLQRANVGREREQGVVNVIHRQG